MADTAQQTKQQSRRNRRMVVGVVTRAHKTPKTLRVEVEYLVRHAKYGKFLRRRMVMHAHDEKEVANIGDRVELMECRPISKTKTWRLLRVVSKGPQDLA